MLLAIVWMAYRENPLFHTRNNLLEKRERLTQRGQRKYFAIKTREFPLYHSDDNVSAKKHGMFFREFFEIPDLTISLVPAQNRNPENFESSALSDSLVQSHRIDFGEFGSVCPRLSHENFMCMFYVYSATIYNC